MAKPRISVFGKVLIVIWAIILFAGLCLGGVYYWYKTTQTNCWNDAEEQIKAQNLPEEYDIGIYDRCMEDKGAPTVH